MVRTCISRRSSWKEPFPGWTSPKASGDTMEKEMEIRIVRNVLEKNKKLADNVREKLHQKGATMFNFMSSPGSGKTTLFQRLVPALKERGLRIGIIEGDVTTAIDAERLNH